MPRLSVHFLRSSIIWLVLQPPALTAEKPPVAIESSAGQSVFSFLPKSLQKNPHVDQTAITEMTPEGKKLTPPARENPAYYVTQSGGFHAEGHGPTDLQMPPLAEMDSALQRALAVNDYLPAAPGHAPSLMIIYHWGALTNLDQGSGEIDGTAFSDAGHRNLLGRAALVGGSKFAAELKDALEKQDRQDEVKGDLPGEFFSMLTTYGPLRRFTDRDAKTLQLYEESRADCYYVIVSAYDYQAATHGQRQLLWRAKMTVDSGGVAMSDTLPGLIVNAGPYLGRDMPEAATMLKPVNRETSTRIGPLEVKEYLGDAAPATPGKTADPAPPPPAKP